MLQLLRNKNIVFLWTSLFVAFVLSIFNFTHGPRFPSQAPYSNPYAGEEQGWRGRREDAFYSSGRAGGGNDVLRRAPSGGWREDGWGGRDNIPMGPIPARHPSSGMQRDTSGEWTNLVCLCQQITFLIMCFNWKSYKVFSIVSRKCINSHF